MSAADANNRCAIILAMEDLFWTLALSALPALLILVLIVWWTIPRSSDKARKRNDQP